MPGYNVHEALYQNCKILDPFVRGSGSTPLLGVQALGWGQYGHIVKRFQILKNLLFSHKCWQKTE